MSDMSDQHEHDAAIDSLVSGLRDAPDEPPAAFMAAVRRRHRRAVLHRAGAIIITACVVALIALAISLPLLNASGPRPPPIAIADRPPLPTARAIVPTAAASRRFIDDPTVLDSPLPSAAPADSVRAGDRPESPTGRSLLSFN